VSTERNFWRSWWAVVLALAAAVIPLLALIPLGGLWLWQQGFVLWWLGAALLFGAGGYLSARWFQHQAARADREQERLETWTPVSPPDEDWSNNDLAAWTKVQKLAAEANPYMIGDSDLLLDAARATIDVVAQHYYPNLKDPIWRFTLPEALLLTERVSGRLREVLLTSVPGSHLIRAGQLRRIWELKPAAETGLRVFRHVQSVYRVARLVNPVGALIAEARDKLLAAAFGETGNQLRRKGARIWIEEVGRAAIELYSGRLRLTAEELAHAAAQAPDLGTKAPAPGPLRIVVGGQTNAGKSSLVNALLGEVVAGVDVLPHTAELTSYELTRDGAPEAVIIDVPGIENERSMRLAVETACEADCVIWVVAAHRPDRALDRSALDAIRAYFAARPQRVMPPVLIVASHVDRLSPAREWSPPYDLTTSTRPKETAIRAALEAIAADLDVATPDVVPVRLVPRDDIYNVDLVWALLAERFDDARRGRAVRLRVARSGQDWKRILKQASRGGRLLANR
jgi:uncharacterized protein